MTWQTVWEAYDVPRLWDAVDLEDDPLGWEQVTGLRRAAGLLTGHSETLRTKRDLVAQTWDGATAELMLSRLDNLITSASRDAASLTGAARGLHGIMTALAGARKKIQPLATRWDEVTGDWIPEFWDEVAAELNDQARTAMLVAAAEVRDHASRMGRPSDPPSAAPDPAAPPPGYTTPPPPPSLGYASAAAPPLPGHAFGAPPLPGHAFAGAASPALPGYVFAGAAPPPLPGYAPTTSDNPELADGMPGPMPVMPGHPVSMLPIPPGNPYAPDGGAYLLPGPGVGQHGFIVPMAAAKPSIWRAPKGTPPAILPVSDSPAHPTPETIAGFQQWYASLATPWRAISARFAPPA